jgi:hypothetical protein
MRLGAFLFLASLPVVSVADEVALTVPEVPWTTASSSSFSNILPVKVVQIKDDVFVVRRVGSAEEAYVDGGAGFLFDADAGTVTMNVPSVIKLGPSKEFKCTKGVGIGGSGIYSKPETRITSSFCSWSFVRKLEPKSKLSSGLNFAGKLISGVSTAGMGTAEFFDGEIDREALTAFLARPDVRQGFQKVRDDYRAGLAAVDAQRAAWDGRRKALQELIAKDAVGEKACLEGQDDNARQWRPKVYAFIEQTRPNKMQVRVNRVVGRDAFVKDSVEYKAGSVVWVSSADWSICEN